MNVSMIGLAVWLTAIELPVGTSFQYSGTLSQQTKSGEIEVKSLTLDAVVVTAENGSTQLAFLIEERGGGAWAWPERFGLLPLSAEAASANSSIRILYHHDDQQYPLPIRSPFFEFSDKLALQSSWTDGRREYVVTRKRNLKNRDGLQVEVSTNSGKSQTLVVETGSGILLSLDEKIVVGRGDELRLKMELSSQSQLSPADLARYQPAMDSLLALRSELGRTGEQKLVELTADQMKLVQKELPRIEKQAEGTPWSRLVATISRDLKQQQKRLDGVAGLQKLLVGHPAPDWSLKSVDDRVLSSSETKGKVVVLHFWQYRGETLVEPYGQIGYLDFLNNKRKKLGVKVIGINVDDRFAGSEQKGAAMRSMKKLIEFMNVGYEMAIDDGSALIGFGDPRTSGAPLPLWIVIGHDGNVSHCHTGLYDIKPDEGLKQLDDAIIDALRKQNAR